MDPTAQCSYCGRWLWLHEDRFPVHDERDVQRRCRGAGQRPASRSGHEPIVFDGTTTA
jgi:hypothetical protein